MKNRYKAIIFLGGISFIGTLILHIEDLKKFKDGQVYSEKEVVEKIGEDRDNIINREKATAIAVNAIKVATGKTIDINKVQENISLRQSDRGFNWAIDFKEDEKTMYFIDINAETGRVITLSNLENFKKLEEDKSQEKIKKDFNKE